MCTLRSRRPLRHLRVPLALALLAALAACQDTTGPTRSVPEQPTEVTLFDFRTAELRDPAAFDLIASIPVRTDQSSGWDFLFVIADDGTPRLHPRSVIVDRPTEAGLQKVEPSFSDLRAAPAEGYEREAPVPIAVGDVLAAVSRQDPTTFRFCRRFGKLEVLSIDPAAGTVTLKHLINPNCENRTLVPGAGGDG